jgi:hypothetical protein
MTVSFRMNNGPTLSTECLSHRILPDMLANLARDGDGGLILDPIEAFQMNTRNRLKEVQRAIEDSEHKGVRAGVHSTGDNTPPQLERRAEIELGLVVLYVRPEEASSPWIDPWSVAGYPVVLVGAREDLLALDARVQSQVRDSLLDAWQPGEALIRLSHLVSERQPAEPNGAGRARGDGRTRSPRRSQSDRPGLRADRRRRSHDGGLVRAALKNVDMDCGANQRAHCPGDYPESTSHMPPSWTSYMPGLDGCEVLAAIRTEGFHVRVLLLTARQQESDVIRGFTLGADDYMVKPFGPMELVARLKRLLWR